MLITKEKPSDTAEKHTASQTLLQQSVSHSYIKIILDSLGRTKRNTSIQWPCLKQSIKWGDICLPKVYNILYYTIYTIWYTIIEETQCTIQVDKRFPVDENDEILQLLLFKDNIILILSSHKIVQNLLAEIYNCSNKFSLSIHTGRGKLTKNIYCPDVNKNLDRHPIELLCISRTDGIEGQ